MLMVYRHLLPRIFTANQLTIHSMKRSLSVLILFLLATTVVYSQSSTGQVSIPAKVIFMRSTGMFGVTKAYQTYIDEQLACRINNKRFSAHLVQPGEHNIAVQYSGKGLKAKTKRIKINAEPGKTYYFQLFDKPNGLLNELACMEVCPQCVDRQMSRLKEDTKCL